MVEILPQYNLGSRIGEGFSKGLNQAFPEELNRNRLAQGMSNLQNLPANANPMQQMASLLSVPGMKPEYLQIMWPLLQQQLARQQFQQQSQETQSTAGGPPGTSQPGALQQIGGQGVSQQAQGKAQPPINEFQQRYGFNPETLVLPAEFAAASKKYMPHWTEPQFQQRISELMAKSPALYPTPESARTQAEREEASSQKQFSDQLNVYERKRSLETESKKLFDEKLNESLQAQGPEIYQALPGEMKPFYRARINDKMLEGKTAEVATDEEVADALDFAKQRLRLQTGSIWKYSPTIDDYKFRLGEWASDFDKAVPAYKKRNASEILKEDLKTKHGFSEPVANTISYPLSKDVSSLINTVKGTSAKVIPAGPAVQIQKAKPPKDFEKVMDRITEAITPDDSLNAIVVALKQKGIDDSAVREYWNNAKQTGKMNHLTARQDREFEDMKPVHYGLKDLLYLFAR